LAAAAIVLLTTLAVYAVFRPRPQLDLVAVLDQVNDQRGRPPEEVEKWFQAQGVRAMLPREFDYSLLVSFAEEKLDGKLVPCLRFVRGQNYASLYVLSASQFDLDAMRRQPPGGSGACSLELRSSPISTEFAYLVFYTGGSLDWLLNSRQGPAT
jgi:hypothetical protein